MELIMTSLHIFYMGYHDRVTEGDTKLKLQLVTIERLADYIISTKHENFLGTGHPGFLRCLLSIKRRYYFTTWLKEQYHLLINVDFVWNYEK